MMISVVRSLSDLGKIYCGDGKLAHFHGLFDVFPPWRTPLRGRCVVPTIPKAFATAKAFAALMGWAPLMGQALRLKRSKKWTRFPTRLATIPQIRQTPGASMEVSL